MFNLKKECLSLTELNWTVVQLCLAATRLAATQEEAIMLGEDLDSEGETREAVISRAVAARDAAVESKNKAEVELASNRIDLMQVMRFVFSMLQVMT